MVFGLFWFFVFGCFVSIHLSHLGNSYITKGIASSRDFVLPVKSITSTSSFLLGPILGVQTNLFNAMDELSDFATTIDDALGMDIYILINVASTFLTFPFTLFNLSSFLLVSIPYK
jgi:hypothetical protein